MQKPKIRITSQILQFALEATHTALNYVTGGVFGIFVAAIKEFSRHRALDSAASIAYYAIFSIFPLFIILVTTLSLFVEPLVVQSQVLRLTQEFFPFSDNAPLALVSQNLQALAEWSGSVSLMAGLGLLWAGSNVFAVLARNINHAWHSEKPLNGYWRSRFIGFITITGLVILLILSLLSNVTLNIIANLRIGDIAINETLYWILLSKFLSYILSFGLFTAIYRWVPNTYVRWSEAAWAALVGVVSWRIAIAGFRWTINQGFLNYQLIYGSLATVVLGIFWIYLGSAIVIFCAYLSAAIAQHQRHRSEKSSLN